MFVEIKLVLQIASIMSTSTCLHAILNDHGVVCMFYSLYLIKFDMEEMLVNHQ